MFKLCMKMSEKTFAILNKYYTFAKKYIPFCLLIIAVILGLAKIDPVIYISIYLVGLLLHLVSLALIQKAVKIKMSALISAEQLKLVDELIDGGKNESEIDTKESN